MLVAELVINTAKHVFPHGRRGCVAIRLTRYAGAGYRIKVADDGRGLPPGFDPSASRGGLGMRIVAARARGHGAAREVDGAPPGARFVLTVPSRRG